MEIILYYMHIGEGMEVFEISSKVIPTESRRQGLNQRYPCPRDIIMFTCISNTSANRVSWMTDIIGKEDLAIFDRTNEPPYTILNDGLDISSTLWNNTPLVINYTLAVNLTDTTVAVIRNGTGISCGEVDQRNIRSSIIHMNITGNHPNPIN